MIYDKIDNWEIYAATSEDIRVGLEYLREVRMDIAVGTYQINPRVKAIDILLETAEGEQRRLFVWMKTTS